MSEKQRDKQEAIRASYRSFIGFMATTFTRVPGFPKHQRESLLKCVKELEESDQPDQLRALSLRLKEACESALEDLEYPSDIAARRKEAEEAAHELENTRNALDKAVQAAAKRIGAHISEMNEALSVGESAEAVAGKTDTIIQDIQTTITGLKQRLDEAHERAQAIEGRLKEAEQHLRAIEERSLIDSLTNLPNRRAFKEHLAQLLTQDDKGVGHALIMFDIDNLKEVNQLHGAIVGNALIMKLSRSLSVLIGPETYLARYGGDEFAVIRKVDDLDDAVAYSQEIQKRVRESRWLYESGEAKMTISANLSAGIAIVNQADSPQTPIERAIRAMEIAQQHGGSTRTEIDIAG